MRHLTIGTRRTVAALFVVVVAALGLTAGAAGATTSGNEPVFHPEIEREVATVMNHMRMDRGLAPLRLQVTTDGTAPAELARWRDCLLALNMSGISNRSGLTHDPERVCGTKQTVTVPGEQIIAMSARWLGGSGRGADPVTTATAWGSSAPHMAWLMSPDATSVMVHAACFAENGMSYMIVAATVLADDRTWPERNTDTGWSGATTGSRYDARRYHSCSRDPAAGPMLPLDGPGAAAVIDPSQIVARAASLTDLFDAVDYGVTDAETLRLYRAFLGRDPDLDGAKYWIGQSRAGVGADDLAWGFARSEEFLGRYGRLADREFLGTMYANMLGRPADRAGLDYWLGEMQRNGLHQHQVVRWVTANDEFVDRFPYRVVR